MANLIKICGLSTAETLDAAVSAGADMVGFVFFERSPRHVDDATARALARRVPSHVRKVALTVDADDARLALIEAALQPDLFQLHGSETPERVAAIALRYGRPVMKAIAIATRDDLAQASAYAAVADRLLFDAKPPPTSGRPGGNGLAFDWSILSGASFVRPWMLSGGLDPRNVGAAIAATGARGVDVSSGVESAPGRKDVVLVRDFIGAARAAFGLAANL